MDKRRASENKKGKYEISLYPPPISLQDHGEHPDMCPTAIIDGSAGCTEKELNDYYLYIRLQERALQRHFGVGSKIAQARMDDAIKGGRLPRWEDLLPRASMPPRAKLPFEIKGKLPFEIKGNK
jgi:hypothetical protein